MMKRIIDWICSFVLVVIVFVMFLQVLSRYVMQFSIAWPGELSRYLFIWVVLLGSVTALIDNEHFEIDAVYNRLGNRGKILNRIFIDLVVASVLIVLVYYGWLLTGKVARQQSPALRLPMRYIYMAIPISSGLMLIHVLIDLFKIAKNRIPGTMKK